MREVVILIVLGLLLLLMGVYIYRAEKRNQRADRESRSPWKNR